MARERDDEPLDLDDAEDLPRKRRKTAARGWWKVAGIVGIIAVALSIAGVVVLWAFRAQEPVHDLNEWYLNGEPNHKEMANKKFKGRGVVSSINEDVDYYYIFVSIGNGHLATFRWPRDSGKPPSEGQGIRFVCRCFDKRTSATQGDMISWSRRE